MSTLYRKTYDARATLVSPGMHPSHGQTRHDDPLAHRVGERIIYWTWIAGLTIITASLIAATVRRIMR